MIDWDTYSELYRRLFITTLQPTREGAQQQLPAQTWNGNFVLDRDWSLELCAAVWQPSSCTPRVQIDKTPQQAPFLSCAGAGQTAVNQIWASDKRERGGRGQTKKFKFKVEGCRGGTEQDTGQGSGDIHQTNSNFAATSSTTFEREYVVLNSIQGIHSILSSVTPSAFLQLC